ncbi:MAG: type II toxin-antitoxin system Phd/YefM family antitoxin [Bifidobacteriaceae bacterium]|jgi:prevent-host-death family protein|nr:type II toxin-antitoxin system Phd/YefM family antitoxin [Bifidobacteriaceae bacterium]
MVFDDQAISIYDFKAHLSQIVAEIERTGDPVVVTRHGRPVVRVLPAAAGGAQRPVGLWRGKMTAPDGWDRFTEQDELDWYGA